MLRLPDLALSYLVLSLAKVFEGPESVRVQSPTELLFGWASRRSDIGVENVFLVSETGRS